jgi:SNF2 family DNA or RNA helicase
VIDDFDRNRFTILRSLTLLRQLSLHPGLVDEDHDAVPCAKLGALVEQLGDVVGGGHRALVFSQFTGFLAKARQRLDAEGIGYCYLDGRTRRRDRVLERFKGGTSPRPTTASCSTRGGTPPPRLRRSTAPTASARPAR